MFLQTKWWTVILSTCQVVQRIKAVDHETRLLVVDQETYESLRSLHLTATEDMAILGTEVTAASPTASPSPMPSSTPASPTKKRQNGSVSKQPSTQSSQVQKPTRRSPSKAVKKVGCKSKTLSLQDYRHTNHRVSLLKHASDLFSDRCAAYD